MTEYETAFIYRPADLKKDLILSLYVAKLRPFLLLLSSFKISFSKRQLRINTYLLFILSSLFFSNLFLFLLLKIKITYFFFRYKKLAYVCFGIFSFYIYCGFLAIEIFVLFLLVVSFFALLFFIGYLCYKLKGRICQKVSWELSQIMHFRTLFFFAWITWFQLFICFAR